MSDRSGPSSSTAGTPSDHLSAGVAFTAGKGAQPPRQHRHESDTATTDVCLGGWDSGVEVNSPGVRICDVDPIGAGVDFVLTIERPCLGHLHGDPASPDEPDGHALTASSHLLEISPGPSGSPPPGSASGPVAPGTVCHDVPAAVLDSLLSLSSELATEREVTPVQAWNSIRSRPQFGGLEVRSLCSLARKLRDAVKCHGFGAVIDKRIFENLVSQLVLDGRPF